MKLNLGPHAWYFLLPCTIQGRSLYNSRLCKHTPKRPLKLKTLKKTSLSSVALFVTVVKLQVCSHVVDNISIFLSTYKATRFSRTFTRRTLL